MDKRKQKNVIRNERSTQNHYNMTSEIIVLSPKLSVSILLFFFCNCVMCSKSRCPPYQLEGKILFLEGEARTVLRVELREPSAMLSNELFFSD